MNWTDILKAKPNEYFISKVIEDYNKKIKPLEERHELLMEKFVMDDITDEEDKEIDKINRQLVKLRRKRDEFIEKHRGPPARTERTRNNPNQPKRQGSQFKGRRHGGRKKKKKKKGQFDVQRGSGQSKSQRRSGGRGDSNRFRKL
jgi:hypothetical protein